MISFNTINYIWIFVAVSTFIILISFNIKAPYGRHSSNSWGRMIANKWGWFFDKGRSYLNKQTLEQKPMSELTENI